MFIQHDVTKIANYKQLEKDWGKRYSWNKKILLNVEEEWKTHPWSMMRSVQLFYWNSKFTELIVKYYQNLVLHNGMRETLNQIRKKFWIAKPINYIRRTIKKCVICNRHEGNPIQYPAPPNLPLYWLSDKLHLHTVQFHCMSIIFMVNYKHLNAGSF